MDKMRTEDIHFLSSDQLQLYARQYGATEAPQTVLCLHGLTRNHKDFEPMIEVMKGDRRYIAWDTRGRGRSARDPDPTNYNIDVYASDVLKLIDHLDLSRFAIVGTSMGGLIAMRLMMLIPDKITGLVLNDIGPRLEQNGLNRIAQSLGNLSAYPSFEAAAQFISAAQASAFPDYRSEDWLAFAKRTMVRSADGIRFDYDPEIAGSLKYIQIDPEAEAVAWSRFEATYARSLLIVRGEISDLLSADAVERMLNLHPDATQVTVPNIGHAPILDEPLAAQAIDNFLKNLD